MRDPNTLLRLSSPLNSSMQKERLIECEIEPRKYYPKSNQGLLINKGSRSTHNKVNVSSSKHGRNRDVITGYKQKSKIVLNVSQVDMASPKSLLNLNQSIIDKIDNFSPPQASPKEEPPIQPQWIQS